jgi:hypothetical protein
VPIRQSAHRFIRIIKPIFILHFHSPFDDRSQVCDFMLGTSMERGAHCGYNTRLMLAKGYTGQLDNYSCMKGGNNLIMNTLLVMSIVCVIFNDL